MTMKQSLCECYRQIRKGRCYSFLEMLQDSELSRSQLNNILNHEARSVSIDKMVEGLGKLGYVINVEIEECE